MNIESAQYHSNGEENVSVKATINGVLMHIPLDPNNRHYAAILEWVAEGNTIEEAD